MSKENPNQVSGKRKKAAPKRKSNATLIAVIVGLIVLIGVSVGVYTINKSANDNKAQTEQTNNRTQNEIKAKSNVAKTPIVQPKEGTESK